MNEQTYEQEISLGKIFYRIFRDWRKICVIAMVVAILAGTGNFVLKKIKTSDPEYLQKVVENFERELTAFHATGETLQRELENLEETRDERESYNETSVLMKINPYREFNASLQLYVATDYQIVPELTYQNIDLSNRILRSYITYMVNGDMYQYILNHLSKPMELRYLKEILSISPDFDNRMVTLSVRHVDAQACEEILNYALEGIMAKQSEIVAVVGEHDLNSINQSAYEAVNLDLDSWQKGNIQYVSDLSIRLQEKSEEFAEWERTSEPREGYTTFGIIKNSIKKMILGFLIGGVLAAVFIAFQYIMSDKIQDAKDLKNRFGLRVIAQIPKIHGKRIWVGFDRLFARMGGLAYKECDAQVLTEVAAQSVCAELMAQEMSAEQTAHSSNSERVEQISETKTSQKISVNSAKEKIRNKKLAFTGNIPAAELEKLLRDMKLESGCTAKSVPNILRNPSAVPAVMEADYIILVEKQEESTYTQIEQELEELAAWKKKVLGVIVVGVDAIP